VKLFVGNLPFSVTENELLALFSQYGNVISCKIIIDRETGRSKGFAFIEMDNADQAMAALDGNDFNGRNIKVNEALERERTSGGSSSRPPRFGGGGGGRDRDRGYNNNGY
jgi:RNA recognition motif-containing protein